MKKYDIVKHKIHNNYYLITNIDEEREIYTVVTLYPMTAVADENTSQAFLKVQLDLVAEYGTEEHKMLIESFIVDYLKYFDNIPFVMITEEEKSKTEKEKTYAFKWDTVNDVIIDSDLQDQYYVFRLDMVNEIKKQKGDERMKTQNIRPLSNREIKMALQDKSVNKIINLYLARMDQHLSLLYKAMQKGDQYAIDLHKEKLAEIRQKLMEAEYFKLV